MTNKELFAIMEQHAAEHGGEETLRMALSYVALATRHLVGPIEAINEPNQVRILTEFVEAPVND